MSKITLIQVGDIHYPDWTERSYETDQKDDKLSSVITTGVSLAPMRLVLGKLASVAEDLATAAVAFMGDFTSRGQAVPLEAALVHMSWLCKAERRREAAPRLLLVPGNHDVSKEEAADLGQVGKFERMQRLADDNLYEPMPIEQHIPMVLGGSQGKVAVFLLNTTLGSWEPYLLPEPLQKAVDLDPNGVVPAQLSQAPIIPAGEPLSGPSSYYDQLDTPYVSARSLQELREAVRNTPRGDAIVVIGHHNLLPQEQPRLATYAELLNGGFFRRFLLSLERPIIYLHGHTHGDIVEEIVNPRNSRARVICVAAPKLEDGFNEISFHFDRRNAALGMRLLPWRLSSDRSAFQPAAANQAACGLQNGITFGPSKGASSIYDMLIGSAPTNRFNIYDIQELTADRAVSGELDSLLLELFFWRWINIDHVAANIEEWIIMPQRIRA